MKILVVEDDRSIRETLGLVLSAYDFEISLVSDGRSTLKHLENHWPDVILLDLKLEDMSGEEVYVTIRKIFGKVPPTVVLSAASEGFERTEHLSGATFLAKPYTLEGLVEALNTAARGATEMHEEPAKRTA